MATAQIAPQVLPTMGDPTKIPGLIEYWEERLAEHVVRARQEDQCYEERSQRTSRRIARQAARDIRRAQTILEAMDDPRPRKAVRQSRLTKRQRREAYHQVLKVFGIPVPTS